MQLLVEPQETPDRPHGPGALPLQKSVTLASRQDVPFQTLGMLPCRRTQNARLAQVRLGRPPVGLGMVRHVVPFQRTAPVGPPSAMQNVVEEHATSSSCLPGGFFKLRHDEPLKIIASECATWSV